MLNKYSKIIKKRFMEKIVNIDIQKKHFYLFPYGKMGKEVLNVLEDMQVSNITVLDNFDGVHPGLNFFESRKIENDEYLILASFGEDIYFRLREEVSGMFPEEQIIDLFEEDNPNYMQEQMNNLADMDYILVFDNKKIYLPDVKDDAIQHWLFRWKTYYEDVYLDYVVNIFQDGRIKKTKGTILDIGANIGNHTLYFAEYADPECIYSFEPIKDTYAILERNIALNQLEQLVAPFNIAVGGRMCHSRNCRIR